MLLLTVLSAAVTAQAQSPASADLKDAAQEAFLRGVASLEEGRYVDARTAFQQSLELLPAPSTAFNLAVTYRETGEPTRAITLFDALLAGGYGEVADDWKRAVEQERATAVSQLATVQLTVEGPPESALEIRLDGDATRQMPIKANPGFRILAASAPGYQEKAETLDLAPGAAVELQWSLEPGEAEDSSVWESPWLYVGAAAVVAGTVVGIVLAMPGDPDRVENPLFGGSVMTQLDRPRLEP